MRQVADAASYDACYDVDDNLNRAWLLRQQQTRPTAD
jgi:hypothetical protein